MTAPDPAANRSALAALLETHLSGNGAAIAFCETLCRVLHVWDDLIDRDKPLSDADVNEAFRCALVVIPANPFFHQHAAELLPIVDTAILNWRAATAMEREGADDQRVVSFVIRSTYIDVVLRVIAIVRGFEYAVAITPAVRSVVHAEGLPGYLIALREELILRSEHGSL